MWVVKHRWKAGAGWFKTFTNEDLMTKFLHDYCEIHKIEFVDQEISVSVEGNEVYATVGGNIIAEGEFAEVDFNGSIQ